MEENKKERKARKKAYKKAKRKYIQPWKALTIILCVVSLVVTTAWYALSMFDNTLAAFTSGTFWELENEDPDAQYFTSDFESDEERLAYGYKVVQQVEEEGATLLMNENNALPLDNGSNVSCFSTSSVNLVYGGTGSGNIDADTAIDLKTSLEASGFHVNETLWNFYAEGAGSEYLRAVGGAVTTESAVVSEAPWEIYTEDVLDSVKAYGDAAIVVLSRVGGEGADLAYQSTNYLALDENEKELMTNLARMKEEGIIKKIIVLINSANALQVDFLKDNEYSVDATLWIGDVGVSGINAVSEILAGKVNPSGSLVDTYCYDNYSSPAMQNFQPTTYAGYEEGIIPENASRYMIYQEGIYVGYKYYETRYEDYVMGTGNAGDYAYGDDVAYPFGFGLSYTNFEYSNMQFSYDDTTDQFYIDVDVTNAGSVAGKETVQVYLSSPYTQYDIDNGVEKASVSLVGFDKTDILEPGERESLRIIVDKRELASYDTYGTGTYILDAGDYYFTCATDAHDAVNNILAAKGYTPATTEGRMDTEGNVSLVSRWNNPTFDATTYSTSKNGTEITNQVSDADINLNENVKEEVQYLTRNDWEGTFPTNILQLTLTEGLIDALQDVQYNPDDYPEMEMPTLGADNGLKLYDMVGLSYDDPKWEKLLDQMTFDEMVSFIGDAFHWTMPIESVQAPGTRDENGPQGLTASLFGASLKVDTTGLTSEDVMAATFNTDLMYEVGKVVGNDCVNAEVTVLYGPGNNIHRTPYGGRNFEYYSEDAFLSGKISAAEVKGIQDKGVHVTMKHFALNDCEQDRLGLGVWLNEQAAREIYLKAFQTPFEEGNANGVMMAYTRWGTTWSGGHYGLVNNIMRNEWGSKGLSITDNVLVTFVNGVDGVMAGTSTFDAMMSYVIDALPEYENDPVVVNAMREACHYNLYAIANSIGMNGIGEDTIIQSTQPVMLTVLEVVSVVSIILFIVCLVMWIVKFKKFKKTEEYATYKNTL